MYVADKEHEFELLPAMSIGERWSMSCVLDVRDDLAAAAATLHPIVLMSKLKSPKIRSPYESPYKSPNGPPYASPYDEQSKETGVQKPIKEVVYVRLRRNERAHQVVLSSAEKYSYAKAMLEPPLDHLSSLSSAEFYQELNTWKETIELGLKCEKARPVNSDQNITDDETESDSSLTFDPTDAMDTVKLMRKFENEPVSNGDRTNDDSELEDDVPPTQTTEPVQNGEEYELPSPKSNGSAKESPASLEISIKEEPCPSEEPKPIEVTTETAVRQVDIVNVPKPKRKGSRECSSSSRNFHEGQTV
ncbi:hypothetical protein F444_18218 [Phytophthora nicotianae P1976]|nr:hypothetical protein F444_18218 [Phytophthora nicotianae P1976]